MRIYTSYMSRLRNPPKLKLGSSGRIKCNSELKSKIKGRVQEQIPSFIYIRTVAEIKINEQVQRRRDK